jgi:Sortase domain
MELTPRRRRALSTVLALVLAAESVSAVAAAGLRVGALPVGGTTATPAAAAPADDGLTAAGMLGAPAPATVPTTGPAAATATRPGTAPTQGPAAPSSPGTIAIPTSPSPVATPAPRLRTSGRETTGTRSATPALAAGRASGVLKGRNHLWIPSLGIDRSVAWFPCDRSRAPDNLVYRWGCAGSNNIYLLGHAYSVFKPLHDAYVGGRLQKGMRAYYADSTGRVHTYEVRWWKLTAPTASASWAWAAQSVPSMTLQTCVGKNSAYRLMVRLAEVRD